LRLRAVCCSTCWRPNMCLSSNFHQPRSGTQQSYHTYPPLQSHQSQPIRLLSDAPPHQYPIACTEQMNRARPSTCPSASYLANFHESSIWIFLSKAYVSTTLDRLFRDVHADCSLRYCAVLFSRLELGLVGISPGDSVRHGLGVTGLRVGSLCDPAKVKLHDGQVPPMTCEPVCAHVLRSSWKNQPVLPVPLENDQTES